MAGSTSAAVGAVTALSADEAQSAFRAALDALARPGTVHRLPAVAGVPAALVPVLALADLGTPVCVLGDGDWSHLVRTATGAPHGELPLARLVAALRPVSTREIASLRTGSVAAPEDAALASLAVEELCSAAQRTCTCPELRLNLSGPGVPGGRQLRVAGLPGGFASARKDAVAGYPAGADLLLVTDDGRVAGLPRTSVVEVVGGGEPVAGAAEG